MSVKKTRPQYLSIDVKANSSRNGSVTVYGPTSVVEAIQDCMSRAERYQCFTQIMGDTMKLKMEGDYRFIEESFVEKVLGFGFEELSDKQGRSHRFSRQVRK